LEIERWFKKNLKRKTKIAVLGLNPHNAELRKDSEENRILIPAISKLKKLKVNVSGPFVTDTIFISEYKKYDVIVGMYHDQVLAPFKTLFKFDAINITLGLSYLRVSPDHGVALDLIGKNKANSTSLVNCIKFINQI
jgi:4-hydroxythreonine-4-phosphate dehydrogenase